MIFGYDPVGNLTSICDAGGTVNYGYDTNNRLTSPRRAWGILHTTRKQSLGQSSPKRARCSLEGSSCSGLVSVQVLWTLPALCWDRGMHDNVGNARNAGVVRLEGLAIQVKGLANNQLGGLRVD
jgi:YD repeat-containing protein